MKPILAVCRWLAALIAAAMAASAWADPPARVGRLADIAGQVWIYDEHEGEWIAALRNRPITTGDRLSSGSGGRAEVQVGAVTWRLDGNSELEVLRLDDEAIRLQLHAGSVALRVRSSDAARATELLTAEGRFAPQRAGHFRIDRDDDVSTATVWSGVLNFRADDSELDLEAGQRIEFWRTDERTHYGRLQPVRDAFSEWALAEEARDAGLSESSRYVSPEVPGVDDLDRHGGWERSSEYGALWTPYHVAPGWAPYRFGHWAYVGPWGWHWVDDAPWGFTPFHYGRWVHFGGRWCWAPGAYVARPVYAPALVAWIGTPHVSIGVNVGGRRPPAVGWFPLGPREIYVPGYRVSPRYLHSVNGGHVTHIPPVVVRQPTMVGEHNRYVNRFVPNAVTAVPARRDQPPPAGGAPRRSAVGARDRARAGQRRATDRRGRLVRAPRRGTAGAESTADRAARRAYAERAGGPSAAGGRQRRHGRRRSRCCRCSGAFTRTLRRCRSSRHRWSPRRRCRRRRQRRPRRGRTVVPPVRRIETPAAPSRHAGGAAARRGRAAAAGAAGAQCRRLAPRAAAAIPQPVPPVVVPEPRRAAELPQRPAVRGIDERPQAPAREHGVRQHVR